MTQGRPRLSHEHRVLLLALMAALPAILVAVVLLWIGDYSAKVRWTFTVLMLGSWWGFAFAVRERVIRPLQTLSNLLAALREGDYSIRARGAWSDDPLGQALREVNLLGEPLREQRLGALEATALLRKVMEEIDVAIFAFDGDERLRLVNRAGERLIGQPAERLLGQTAEALGLADCLRGAAPRTLDTAFPGGAGRWELRRSTFHQGGLAHELVVLSDLSRTLREQERKAWQSVIRVLSHEINNSLAPIKSLAAGFRDLLGRDPRPADLDEDLRQGLSVIAARSESLSRFMASYARLARLPQPRPRPVDVAAWVHRVAELETRLPVEVHAGPDLTIEADGDQLDQLLINLVRNAADAALETGGSVDIGWRKLGSFLEVSVEDGGPGLSETTNLFVPFFTTKPNGSGIGLALSRQIAEAHGGALSLQNRKRERGCEARLRLPLKQPA